MRSALRTLSLLVVAASGFNGLAAIGQSGASSLPVDALSDRYPINSDRYGLAGGIDANLIEERDLPNDAPHYPTIAQLGLQYTASLKQADSLTVSNLTQEQQGASGIASPMPVSSEQPSYMTIDAPSAIAARESSGDTSETAGVLNGSRANDLKMQNQFQRNSDCEDGTLRGKPCRVSWWRVLAQSFYFLSTQHLGNIGLDHDTRNALERGNFWGNYVYCVEHYRWWRWKDDDPFLVDYVGHPMMGAVTSSIYEQNDPKQRALMFENTQRYWMGRLRAMAYSAAYSAQWKVGPLSEASIGSTGLFYYIRARDGIWTNETGMQDFFITPIGGMAWNVGEDVIDRYILRHVRHARRNKWVLLASSLTTPGKSAANLTRFRAPYYRDYDMETAGALGLAR
jgi:hypothetical protein